LKGLDSRRKRNTDGVLRVVDDNDDNLDMPGTYLRACGADVLQARNALSSLASVDTTRRINAIVTDLSMPSIDGVGFVQRLRQASPRAVDTRRCVDRGSTADIAAAVAFLAGPDGSWINGQTLRAMAG
jgi:CheY-like chemotaxis protein